MEKKQMKEFMNVRPSVHHLHGNPSCAESRASTDEHPSPKMYSNLVQNCFEHCVTGFESKSLTSREESCVMRCVDKHMKGSQRLGDRFQEQNAAMAQGGMPR